MGYPIKPLPQLTEKEILRFWSRIDKRGTDECWPWLGRTHRQGYGFMDINGGAYLVPRIAFLIANGIDPGPLGVLHSCDSPICANPEHLHSGTHVQNMLEAKLRHRIPARRGLKCGHAILNEEKVHQIKSLLASGTMTLLEIGRQFGVARTTIFAIKAGVNWPQVS